MIKSVVRSNLSACNVFASWRCVRGPLNPRWRTKCYQSIRTMSSNGDSFRFTDYDCLGFDLDNTLCRYKIGAMVKLEYDALAKFLVEKRGYDPKYLYKPMEENVDFMLKGLILDVEKGNILRIDSEGRILHGTHGTAELNKEELREYYGNDCR